MKNVNVGIMCCNLVSVVAVIACAIMWIVLASVEVCGRVMWLGIAASFAVPLILIAAWMVKVYLRNR